MIRAGKHPAWRLTRARILLKADAAEGGDGWSDSQIAAALDINAATVARTRQQLVEEGFEAVLQRKHSPASAKPRIFDGASEGSVSGHAGRIVVSGDGGCDPPVRGGRPRCVARNAMSAAPVC